MAGRKPVDDGTKLVRLRRAISPTQIDVAVGKRHDVAVEAGGIGGTLDDVLELFLSDCLVEIGGVGQGTVKTIQVVEAIAVHQPFHLVFEDGVEGWAEHAAVDVRLGETAEPEVN